MGTQDPQLVGLIKPEQVPKLPHLNEQQKQTYMNGVGNLWSKIYSHAKDSSEYQDAKKKLTEVSVSMKNGMKKWQELQAQQQAHQAGQGNQAPNNRPISQGHPDPRQPAQQPHHAGLQPQPTQQFDPKVLEQVRNFPVAVPPQVAVQGPEKSQEYVKNVKLKYAQNLQSLETTTKSLNLLNHHWHQRQSNGRPVTSEEQLEYNHRKGRFEEGLRQCKEILVRIKKQQDDLKAQQQNQNPAGPAGSFGADGNRDSVQQPQVSQRPQSSQQHLPVDHQPYTVNSAVSAARIQATASAQVGNQQPSQVPPSQTPDNTARTQVPTTQPHAALAGQQPQTNSSPQTSQPPNAQTIGPQAPSQQGQAQQGAQPYSQSNQQQATPRTANYPPSNVSAPSESQNNNNSKMPIPKNLQTQPPQAVQMGTARPTFSGGPSTGAAGPLGQPAIPKLPGYILEGEGERVLSKKKLEELVRQVTGGTEGEEGEGLTADVEEVSIFHSALTLYYGS